jgi:hypothetical protein
LGGPNSAILFVFSHCLTYFVHNVAATVSYDRKELLGIRTAIAHLELDKDFYFNESDAKDILLCQDKAQIPVISVKKRQRKKGEDGGVHSKNLLTSR